MINELPYESNDLMQKIRREHGTIPGSLERDSDIASNVQEQLGFSAPGSTPASRETRENRPSATGDDQGSNTTKRITQRSYRRKRRTDSASDESDIRINSDSESAHSEIQYRKLANDEKPSGLAIKTNAKERQARKEQEQPEPEPTTTGKLTQFISKRKASKKKETRGKPLSSIEAEELAPKLLAALLDYFTYADEMIYATNKMHAQIDIWSSIDEEDTQLLVDVWIQRARHDPRSADHVIKAINAHQQIRVAMIVAPRTIQTFMVYIENGVGVR